MKAYRYSVQPFLDSRQVENTHLLSLNRNIHLSYFLKETNYIQFEDKRILVFDKKLSDAELSQKLKINYLYISGCSSSDADLNFINKNDDYYSLIIDNTNSNFLINKLQKETQSQHFNFTHYDVTIQ